MNNKKIYFLSWLVILSILVFFVFTGVISVFASTTEKPTSGPYLEYNGNYLSLQENTYVLYNQSNFYFAGTGTEPFTLTSTYPVRVLGHSQSLEGSQTTSAINFVDKVYCNSIDVLPDALKDYYLPLSECPIYHVPLTIDDLSRVYVDKNYGDKLSLVVQVPHGTDISKVVLDSTLTFTLPSNQYVTDLVTDLEGTLSNSRYKPIVNSLYKKTWGQSYSTNYRSNITLFTETKEHIESEVFGDTYFYTIPIDIIELGRNALSHSSLSNIVNYPNYTDYLVSNGYISSTKFYVLTPGTQGVIKYIDWNDNNEKLSEFLIDKINSDVTFSDVSESRTQALIDKRNEDIYEKGKEYSYNPNIEIGQNIVEKLNSIVNTVTGMIGTVSGVGAMFGLFFTCLPSFVLDIISFTIISLCIISIYKALRG